MANEISPKEAKKLVLGGKAILLDIRHQEEAEFTTIKGSTWIELNELKQRIGELPKDKEILCICRTGGRSSAAAQFLSENGFKAKNVTGGIIGWNAIDPKVRKYVYFPEGNRLVVKPT